MLVLESGSPIDHSRLAWQPQLAAATVPLLVMRAPKVVCKISGCQFLDADGRWDRRVSVLQALRCQLRLHTRGVRLRTNTGTAMALCDVQSMQSCGRVEWSVPVPDPDPPTLTLTLTLTLIRPWPCPYPKFDPAPELAIRLIALSADVHALSCRRIAWSCCARTKPPNFMKRTAAQRSRECTSQSVTVWT